MKSTHLLISALIACSSVCSHAADITIDNQDGPGEGFNDTTPTVTVGGNTGTTLGQQRLNVFQRAADILETYLNINTTIVIDAQFDPLTCNSSSAVLGSAGSQEVYRDFSGAIEANTWYPVALANNLSSSDLSGATAEIFATFNSSIDNNNNCLSGTNWYYGFDDPVSAGAGSDTSLLSVVIHEILHGLGVSSLVDSEGRLLSGFIDIYSKNLRDTSLNNTWDNLSEAQRKASAINTGNLVWNGSSVNTAAAAIPVTAGVNNSRVEMFAPNPYQGGSSVSHFSNALTPNELMEPSYTEFLDEPGLATPLLADIGWALAPTNTAPVITAISNQSLDEDSDKTLSLSATDANNDSLTFSITNAPSQLNVSITGTTLTLDPIADFNGNGSVTVQVSDGSLTDSTSFNVTVNAVNDAPVFNVQSDIDLVNTNTSVITLSATDIDSASNTLVYSVTSFDSASLTASISADQLTITPKAGITGSSIVSVQVSDGDKTDQQTFAVNLRNPNLSNQAPVLTPVGNQVLLAGDTLTVNLSATDAENDPLTYSVSGSTAGIQANISGAALTITAAGGINSSADLTVSVNDGQDNDSEMFNVTVYPAFTLSDGNNQIRNGETLSAGLATTDLQLSGGNNQLTLAVFFNGEQRDGLLTNSDSGYQLALPTSGAFAGIYRVDVTDSNNLSSHFFIERPLRLVTSATPLLDLAEQQLWIEGAPAGSNIALSSDTDKLSFQNTTGQEITEVTATDQDKLFNRATANLELVAGQLPENITFMATSPNIPDSEQQVDTLAGKNVSIQVTDTSANALSNASVNAEDNRLADWQLTASVRSNDNGNARMILPQEEVRLIITADDFIDQSVILSANETDLTVTMEKMTAPFTLTGRITAQGFNFSSERPQVRLNLSDGTSDNLTISLDESNTVARFEAQLDLNITSPESITIQHSQASTLTQSIPQGIDELVLELLLLALPINNDDEAIDTGSSGGNGTLLLLLVTILSLIRRKTFTA